PLRRVRELWRQDSAPDAPGRLRRVRHDDGGPVHSARRPARLLQLLLQQGARDSAPPQLNTRPALASDPEAQTQLARLLGDDALRTAGPEALRRAADEHFDRLVDGIVAEAAAS